MTANSKKIVRDAIKNKLNRDEEYKEYYSSLSDKEKENLKEKYLTSFELNNSISKARPISSDQLQELGQMFLERTIKSKGYKKPHGRKASIYVKNKKFIYRYENYWIALCPTEANKKGMMCKWMFLFEVRTEKGMVYVDIPGEGLNEDLPYIIFTAHFFDRYQERLGIEGDRYDTIEAYLRHELAVKGPTGINREEGNTLYNLSKGLALGTNLGNMILNKTFISGDQINSYQKKIKEELYQLDEPFKEKTK